LERNKEVVKKYFEVVVNERKLELLDELFHQDRVYIDWDTGDREEGLHHLKIYLPYFFNAFPDIFCSIQEIIAEGDKVMVKVNYKATHKGEFRGYFPSGNALNISNAYIYYLQDGKITSSSSLRNLKVLESQLIINE
jgi:steroid delta-isomerase-like uncharacterized protein